MKTALKLFLLTVAVTCASLSFAQVTMAANYDINVNLNVPFLHAGLPSFITSNVGGIDVPWGPSQVWYPQGSTVIMTAHTVPGYTFAGWQSFPYCTGFAANCTVTIPTNQVYLQPAYTVNQYTVSATPPVNGKIVSTLGIGSHLDCPGTACSVSKEYYSWVRVTPVPNPGYVFNDWGPGACSGQPDPCWIIMPAGNVNVGTANFVSTNYTLSVTKNIPAGGTVTGLGINCGIDCTESIPWGSARALTATALPGYTFSSWTNCTSVVGNTCNVTIVGNRTVTANFVSVATQPLTVLMSGSGTVTSAPAGINCGADCTESYANGTSVTLTATAPPMWSFDMWWGGGCSGSSPTCTVTMDSARTVQAFFNVTPISYTMTVAKAGIGSGYVTDGIHIDCGLTCGVTLANGTAFAFTATPSVGSVFSGWSGGGCSGTGICNVLLNANTTVTATFTTTPTFTLSATDPPNGTITSSGGVGLNLNCGLLPCSVTKNSGDIVTINAVPAVGYSFVSWGAGACQLQANPCTLTMDANKGPITATFMFGVPTTYTLTATPPIINGSIASSGGTGTNLNCGAICSATKNGGDTVTVTAIPVSGFIFSSWGAGACQLQGPSCTVNMTGNLSVGTANFIVAPPPAPPSSSGNALNPCWDIQFDGQPVLVNGVPNSGVMQYDPTGGLPAPEHEACMWAPDNDAYTVIYAKGWLWDTNLGWISMYCEDEDGDGVDPLIDPTKPYTNMGIPCGTIKYGVWMEGYAQANRGRLHGFAWGDNVGYISFNCAETATCGTSGYYVQPDVTKDPWNPGSVCTGYVNKAGCDPATLGPLFSHAWSDNVGWLNLTGVRFPWFWLIDAPVLVQLIITPDPLTATKNTAPVADNNDFYKMDLKMTKLDGTAIDPSRYAITFTPVWAKDSVSYDQTALTVPDCKSSAQGGSCAVSKPLSFASFGAYGALTPMAYTAPVKSAAPTTSMNGYDKDNNGTIDFSYENFLVPAGVTKPPVHELILGNVQASVRRTADGICSFGTVGAACGLKDVSAGGQNFGFVPAVEVTELTDSLNGETIAANYLVPNLLTYTTTCRKALAGCIGAVVDFKSYVTSPFELVYNDDPPGEDPISGAECEDPNFVRIPPLTWNGQFAFTPVFTNAPTGGCLTEGPSTAKDPTVFTVVQHGATKYYSNKLPRKTGALIYNPVADVKGSIYSTGVSNPQTGAAYRSLGDISTNVLREQIVRNVYNIIGGITVAMGSGTVTVSGYASATGFNASPASAITKLQFETVGAPKVYYSNGNAVVFDNGATDISWTGERTFIVMGADVYIKSNLYVAPGVSPKPKLGIIVLKDEQFQKGGNIYIAPGVTNIQANIYADGSVFSYDSAAVPAISAAKEPIFTDENQRRGVLINQLFIEGSLASQNTIGGAVYTPNPILGNGSVESADDGNYGSTPKGRSRARLYDLNFLRYYGLVYERDADGNAVDKNGDGVITDVAYPTGDMVPNPAGKPALGLPANSYSAEYILFDPPTATLPGFSVQPGAEVKIGPQ